MKNQAFYFSFLIITILVFGSCKNQPAETNQEETPAKTEAATATDTYSGIYAYSNGENGGGEIKVVQKGDSIQFALRIVGRPPAYNQGMMDGTAALVGNVATVDIQEFGKCKFTITFSDKEAVIVSQEDAYDCGFGNGVIADGTYVKK